MKAERKTVQYFVELPYTVVLRRDEDGDWVARIQELEGCTAHGATKPEALENLEEVQRAWIEDALETGSLVPEPAEEALPSGKWLQRVPRSLHRKLVQFAQEERVSLNQLVTSMLSEAVGRRGLSRVLLESKNWPIMPSAPHVYLHSGQHLLGELQKRWTKAQHGLRQEWLCHFLLADWDIDQPSPPMSLHFAENLVTAAPATSDRPDTNLKVSERGKKEEHRHNEYAVGL